MKTQQLITAVILSLALPSPSLAAAEKRVIIDLTHAFDKDTIYWPTAPGFELEKRGWTVTDQGYFYAANLFKAPEHGGTHLDAPIHFAKGGWTVEQIPVEHLIGAACVLHLAPMIQNQVDYQIGVQEVKNWEQHHGSIQACQFILFHTGWDRYWGNKRKYLGSATLGDTQHLHFPGLAPELANYLETAGIKGVGLDTASLDYGQSRDFRAHRILLGSNIFGLENLANLAKLPATGAELIVAPMKITQGTGGPTRVLARFPAKD